MTRAQQVADLLAAARLLSASAPELDDVTALDLERNLQGLLTRIQEAHAAAVIDVDG
jgi:hypothetical protein